MKRKIFALAFIISIGAWSCQTDDNQDLIDEREKIAGNWMVEENSDLFGKQNYEVLISLDAIESNKVYIDNFFGMGKRVTAYYENRVVIVDNEVLDGWTLKGGGNVGSDFKTISWAYTADDGHSPVGVTAMYIFGRIVARTPDAIVANP